MVIHVAEQWVIKWVSGIDIEPLQLFPGEICISIHYDVAPVSDCQNSEFYHLALSGLYKTNGY